MNANSNERSTAEELYSIFNFWYYPINKNNVEKKNLAIKEKKLKQHLKKLIKKYQTSQLCMKRILMLYILVERLYLAIYYRDLLTHPLLLHILIMKKVTKVFYILKFFFFFFFKRIIINFMLL
jgi:hypothetical protein